MRRGLKSSIAVASVTLPLIFAATASANPLVVTTTSDGAPDPAGCSLREAIATAEENPSFPECGTGSPGAGAPGKDTITFSAAAFPPGAPKEVIDQATVFNNSFPGISHDLEIVGPGIGELEITNTSAASANGRIFQISAPAAVKISGVEITSGNVLAAGEVLGGGITSSGNLTLERVRMSGNTAVSTIGSGGTGSPNAYGGAIYSSGTLTISESVLEGNQAVMTSNSTVDFGTAGGGGAIRNDGALTVDRSTIAGNTASETTNGGTAQTSGVSGGGILTFGVGTVTVSRSTISGNTASSTSTGGSTGNMFAHGGGIAVGQGTPTVELSTLTGNNTVKMGPTAWALQGTALAVFNGSGGLNVNSSTIASNGDSGEEIYRQGGTVTLTNTIVSDPTDFSDNCLGTINSGGYNIDFNAGNASCIGDSTDLEADPMLGSLQNNGGPTETMLPAPGSPAVDQGSSSEQFASGDQRELLRPANFGSVQDDGDSSDIGSVEIQAGPITFTGTTPASPNSVDTPQVRGTVPSVPEITGENPMIQLYTVNGCSSGAIGAPTTSSGFASPGITVGPLAHNATTTFYGRLTTDYGPSGCWGSISYTQADSPAAVGENPECATLRAKLAKLNKRIKRADDPDVKAKLKKKRRKVRSRLRELGC